MKKNLCGFQNNLHQNDLFFNSILSELSEVPFVTPINLMKQRKKTHMIISNDAEKASEKILAHFVRNAQQISSERKFPQHNKVRQGKSTANKPNDETLIAFPLYLESRQGCLLKPFLLNKVTEVLTSVIKQRKIQKPSKSERKKQNYLWTQMNDLVYGKA